MSRGKRTLTQSQQQFLQYLSDTDDRWRAARKFEAEEAKRIAAERVAGFAAVRDKAIWEAVEVHNISKAEIGRTALGTSNPNVIYEAIARVHATMEHAGVEYAEEPTERFSWGSLERFDTKSMLGFPWVLDSEQPDIQSTAGGSSNPGHAVWVRDGLVGEPKYITLAGTTRDDGTAPAGLIEWVQDHLGELEARA
jgi:hypothetical protein